MDNTMRSRYTSLIGLLAVFILYSSFCFPVQAVTYCALAPLTGNYTISGTCTQTNTVEGGQEGDVIIAAGATVTLLQDQILVYNSGKKITITDTAVVNLNNTTDHTAKMKQGTICRTDTDSDTYAAPVGMDTQSYTLTTCPAGTIARTAGQLDDCNDADPAIFTNLVCYPDADGDGAYGTSNHSVCAGATCASAGESTDAGTDCNDILANGGDHVKYIGFCYRDADNDSYGVQGGTTYNCMDNATCLSAAWGSVVDGIAYNYNFSNVNTDCSDAQAAVWRATTCYQDVDGDGVGRTSSATYTCMNGTISCAATAGAVGTGVPITGTYFSTTKTDCNDGYTGYLTSATCYLDWDLDTYTRGSAALCINAPTCGGSTGRSGVDTGTVYAHSAGQLKNSASATADCCDTNATVKPGQTTYYTTAMAACTDGIAPTPLPFDYNCSGVQDMASRTIRVCMGESQCGENTGGGIIGWATPTPAACGGAGKWCYMLNGHTSGQCYQAEANCGWHLSCTTNTYLGCR